MRDKVGICQWFHYQDHSTVGRAVDLMKELGIRHLRTGVSWADYHRPGGSAWYEWMFDQLRDFELLLSVWHTPPSIAEGGVCSGPPRRLLDFADFIWQINREFRDCFAALELWNEPNNRYKWNFVDFDPDWKKFAEMIAAAAWQAKVDGQQTVLGGMVPVDPHWLELMHSHGALEDIDVVAIHGFPEMWWPNHPNWDWRSHWRGWSQKVASLAEQCGGRPLWITETGLATWDLDQQCESRFELQKMMLYQAVQAPVERVYWYSLIDLDPDREAIEGFHVDENEYHLGLVDWQGNRKPAFNAMQRLLNQTSERAARPRQDGILVK